MLSSNRTSSTIHAFRRSLYTPASCSARIAEHNALINAFVRTSPAPSSSRGTEAGPLARTPVAVKDSICTRDMGTGCASEMLRDFHPPYDATVVRLLREAGADIIGKTNCDEFGMGSLNTHTVHGPVINPFSTPARLPSLSPSKPQSSSPPTPARSAGGSSGGSAAAVAAGMCYAALGTDTGGSTRLPASYCGIVGLKPSYGLLSRWGVVSFADSLDCVGVMARDVESVGKVFDVLNVYDARDPTAVLPDARERARTASRRRVDAIGWHSGKRLDGLRVGVPQEYFPREISPSILEPVRRAIRSLKARGAVVVPTSMPNTGYALSAYYVLASAEASSCLARFDGIQYGSHVRPPPGTDIASSGTGALYAHSRTAGFGREVKKRILLGTYALSADAFDNYFLQAQRVRQRVKEDFDGVFGMRDHRLDEVEVEDGVQGDGVDVLLHPSAIQTAPELGLSGQGYVQDVLTVPASLAGVPGLSVPMSGEDGWPVGVSIVGQWGSEPLLFAVGQAVEDVQE